MSGEVPGFDAYLNPILKALHAEGGSAHIDRLYAVVVTHMRLPVEQLQVIHNPERGSQTEVAYRMAWARTYLRKAGLIHNPSRGVWALTPKGLDTTEVDSQALVRSVRAEGRAQKKASEAEDTPQASPVMPVFQHYFNPILRVLQARKGAATIEALVEDVIRDMGIPEAITSVLHNPEKSSRTEVEYRMAWSRTYLKKAGLLENPSRGMWALTPRGLATDSVDPDGLVAQVRAQDRAKKQTREASSEPPKPEAPTGPAYYGLLVNPRVFDIEGAAQALESTAWRLPKGDVRVGDRLAFWRTLWRDKQRGVVALGEVIEEASMMAPVKAEIPFWKVPVPSARERRFRFRFIPARQTPLWLSDDDTGLLSQLTVSRGQGTRLFHITPDQWEGLEALAGVGKPPKPAATRTPFEVGQAYKRSEVAGHYGETALGNWTTGYHRVGDDVLVFANVGVAGRTGHDYANQWLARDTLKWEGKTQSQKDQPLIQAMVSGELRVHLFTRHAPRMPFIYQGLGVAKSVEDTVPVTIIWQCSRDVGSPPAPKPEPAIPTGPSWLNALPEEVRGLLEHLDEHGVVSESDAAMILGSHRKVRRFSKNLEAYLEHTPFHVRVESVLGVKRYVREDGG